MHSDVITRTLIANLLSERICLLVFLPHFARAPAANVFIAEAKGLEDECLAKIVSSTQRAGSILRLTGYLLVESPAAK